MIIPGTAEWQPAMIGKTDAVDFAGFLTAAPTRHALASNLFSAVLEF
jgi:hypothetical protein